MAGNHDVLSPRVLMRTVSKIPINRNYIGLTLLPLQEVEEWELTWDQLRDEQQLAGVYAANGQIKPGSDEMLQQMFADVVRIGASRIIDEQSVRVIREPGTAGVTAGVVGSMRRRSVRKIARQLRACNREVDATVEYLIINALLGHITWPPAELKFDRTNQPNWGAESLSVDYQLVNKKKATDLDTAYMWDDTTNGDVVDNLEQIATELADTAGVDTSALTITMSRWVLRYMAQHAKIRDIVKYTSSEVLDFGRVQAYFEGVLGWRFRIYDAQWSWREHDTTTNDLNKVTVKRQRFLPTNKVIITPDNVEDGLGDFATSPSKANNWRPGKFTWNKENENPWTTEIGIGLNGWPRITHPETIYVLQVMDDPKGLTDVD